MPLSSGFSIMAITSTSLARARRLAGVWFSGIGGITFKANDAAFPNNSLVPMKSTLAVLLMWPLVLSAEVRIVAPDWSAVNGPYIEDPVPVQIVVNGAGSAVFVTAPDPLPDNVLSSIEQSRFDDKRYLGKVVELTILVRRALTEGREQLLMPDWDHKSPVFIPASCCFKMPTICSSLNRVLFICGFPFWRPPAAGKL